MWLRNKIRDYLGITEIKIEQELIYNQLCMIYRRADSAMTNTDRLVIQTGAIGPAIGRILGKLDPLTAVSELDPARKAASDAIGEAVIKKLEDEQKARMHTEGKL